MICIFLFLGCDLVTMWSYDTPLIDPEMSITVLNNSTTMLWIEANIDLNTATTEPFPNGDFSYRWDGGTFTPDLGDISHYAGEEENRSSNAMFILNWNDIINAASGDVLGIEIVCDIHWNSGGYSRYLAGCHGYIFVTRP